MNLIKKFEHYIKETLDISTGAELWENSGIFAFYLRERYCFYKVVLLNSPCLIMASKNEQEETPGVIRKHMDQVHNKWGKDVIFLHPLISSYNRKRLIQQKVPFVIPGYQMYLPLLGIDFREHFKRLQEVRDVFSPAAQALMMSILYRKEQFSFMPAKMAKELGYSPMTMTRAFDEFKQKNLGEHGFHGKGRFLDFQVKGKVLWEKAMQYMKTPVVKRYYIFPSQKKDYGVYAGLDALSRYTNLLEPQNPVFAVSGMEWKKIHSGGKTEVLPKPEPGAIEIEEWSYDPKMFTDNKIADRLSVYASIEDSHDERIKSALQEMLEGVEW